jgi:hypothetical protein
MQTEKCTCVCKRNFQIFYSYTNLIGTKIQKIDKFGAYVTKSESSKCSFYSPVSTLTLKLKHFPGVIPRTLITERMGGEEGKEKRTGGEESEWREGEGGREERRG